MGPRKSKPNEQVAPRILHMEADHLSTVEQLDCNPENSRGWVRKLIYSLPPNTKLQAKMPKRQFCPTDKL